MKQFEVIGDLGSGAFANVYKVRRKEDHQVYALKKVKLLSLTEKEKENALNEVRILASIKCPNIIAFKESFLEQETGTLCLITEFADNGDLEQRINTLKKSEESAEEREIWSTFIQIAKALKSLHANNIAHRDLKVKIENIQSANVFLFKNGNVKIGDMNVSKVIKDTMCFTQTGTPYYASPEVWKDIPYDTKSDIWSLGCLIYEMAALRPPFMADNMEGLYKRVLKGIYPKVSTKYSKYLKNLIRMMLQVDPENRPNINSLLEFAEISFNKIFNKVENKDLSCERGIESAKNIGEIKKGSKKMASNNNEEDECLNLLDTIRLPRKIAYLGSKLPKSNYEIPLEKINKKRISMKLLPSLDRTKLEGEQEVIKEKLMKVKSEKLLPFPAIHSKRVL